MRKILARLLASSLAALALALCAPAPAPAHTGEAPDTWYPSTCWAGGEIWHYTAGSTTPPDWYNTHWWWDRWSGAYRPTWDPAIQKAYLFTDGGECGWAQFVTAEQYTATLADGYRYVIVGTKCAIYFERVDDPNHASRIARNPQPPGCSMIPGQIVTTTLA